jgi:hypothetical protein
LIGWLEDRVVHYLLWAVGSGSDDPGRVLIWAGRDLIWIVQIGSDDSCFGIPFRAGTFAEEPLLFATIDPPSGAIGRVLRFSPEFYKKHPALSGISGRGPRVNIIGKTNKENDF